MSSIGTCGISSDVPSNGVENSGKYLRKVFDLVRLVSSRFQLSNDGDDDFIPNVLRIDSFTKL